MNKIDKLWEIADRYNTSNPVSGNWDTETEHELNAISKELEISKQEAKQLMIKELGFDESMFDGISITSSRNITSSQEPSECKRVAEVEGGSYVRNSLFKIKPNFPEDDVVRYPEELAKETADNLKKAGYDARAVNDYVEVNANDSNKSELSRWGEIVSSRQIKSARYIATDPESGEVLGSADTYEEAVNEWGEDVTITDSEAAEGQGGENLGLFSSIDKLDNNYITEGMRVTWGEKGKGKVIMWDGNDVLVQGITSTGDDYFIVGYDFKLTGNAKEPHLTWRYGDYDAGDDKEQAIQYFENRRKDISNSRKLVKSSISAAALEEQLDGQFWTRADDFENEVNEAGWDVEDVNNEYATISNDKGSQYEVRFYDHGEGRSFTMESFKCIYHDEDDDDEIELANQLNGDKAFLSNIVSSVLTQSMTEEQAVKRIALRNNCNQAFARNILSSAMEDTSLIQSGIMAIADDINKDFNIDGDINSWFTDYVPREGAANTVGGEILRAFAQIRSRYYNDGDKIGVGMGKDTVNPAARYLVDKCVGWTEVSNIEEMLSGDSDINKDNNNYNEWLEDCEYSLEDYLRNNEDYFHTVNKDDMWNYKTNDDSHDSIDEVFIEDDDNNEYWFQRGGDGWHCYTINYSHQPQYEVNSWVDDLDDIPDTSGDFCDFELDGFEYSAEKSSNGQDWMITDVRLPNGIVQVDEEWEISDFEPYTIYDSQGREISINELY